MVMSSLLLSSLLLMSGCPSKDVVVRAGEYPDKPGKRVYLTKEELSTTNGLPVHKDSKGYYLCEYDINYRLAEAINWELQERGINSILLTSTGKGDDLNSAGREASQYDPSIYLSIHHNSFKDDSTGYLFMTNSDEASKNIAQILSDSLVDNPMGLPQWDNRIQDGYIGEMNETKDTVSILLEAGFFSNKEEVSKITNLEQVDFIANSIADELVVILESMG